MNGLYRFYKELQRRNVIKAGISYLVVSWVLLQVVALIGDILNAPSWLGRTLLITLIVLLPIWLIVSWYYELTPEGLKKTVNVPKETSIAKKTSQKLNQFIIIFLTLAVILLVVDRFFISERIRSEMIAEYTPPDTTHAIAVLPFSDLSPEGDHAYFADGLSEELLNLLSRIRELKVTSRTSSFSFKDSDLPITNIAQALGVAYILEGSIRKNGNQLRITAQLINAKTDEHIWSENFDRTFDNIFAIQDEVAQAVVKTLEVQLLGAHPKTQKTDPEVYRLYLQASQAYLHENESDILRAEQLLTQALSIDSTYTPAEILLAKTHQLQANYGITDFHVGNQKAIEIIDKVIQKHPKFAEAIALRGDLALAYEWDFKKAETLIEQALNLEPGSSEVIGYAATLELSLANVQKSITLHEYAATLDPLNSSVYFGLGLAYYCGNDLTAAENAFRKSEEIRNDTWALQYYISKILMLKEEHEKALAVLEKERDERWRLLGAASIYHAMGDDTKSTRALKKLSDQYGDEMAYQIAQAHTFRGEKSQAFQWLDQAYKIHDLGLNEILSEPDFKPLYNDPRWDAFIKKLGFYGKTK